MNKHFDVYMNKFNKKIYTNKLLDKYVNKYIKKINNMTT